MSNKGKSHQKSSKKPKNPPASHIKKTDPGPVPPKKEKNEDGFSAVSEEDSAELRRLRTFVDENNDFDIEAYKQQQRLDVDEEIKNEKTSKEKSLDDKYNLKIADLEKKHEDRKKELNAELENLNAQINELKKDAGNTKTEISTLEDRKKNLEKEIDNKICLAFETREKENNKLEGTLNKRKDELNIEAKRQKEKEEDLNFEKKAIDREKERLAKREEVFLLANPERLTLLENEMREKQNHVEEIQDYCRKMQQKIDSFQLDKIKIGERTETELLHEIEQKTATIKALDEKSRRFTDYQLMDMQRALEENKQLEKEKARLANENGDLKHELSRLENADRELENIQAQVNLIRTLNDNLKQELQTAKQTLESRVGEICPNLTNVDINETKLEIINKFEERKKLSVETKQIRLVDIVRHVKAFAEGREKPLHFKERDLRAFLAGLAASKFSIIQGLSGTGKTSLPDVFAKALFAEHELVSVESSWRDRNELLGYYNDFNKKFTAKDFTCYLYRAGLDHYKDVPFFIVLDEMNISRVEYYFADFLSIMQKENPDDWKVSLVDVDLRSLPSSLSKVAIAEYNKSADVAIQELLIKVYNDGTKTTQIIEDSEKRKLVDFFNHNAKNPVLMASDLVGGPQHLINGNTISIPKNVWFIGTANRDESTFEISDKVYDRAQVLNFFEQQKADGTKPKYDSIYMPFSRLNDLFNEAKKNYKFDYSLNPLIKEIDKYLIENFKIPFGNRIGNQINDFVSVYKAAADDGKTLMADAEIEAIDFQLANKVLRKLENRDETDQTKFINLKELFDNKGLRLCSNLIGQKIIIQENDLK